MKYLARLKSETRLPSELPKLSKGRNRAQPELSLLSKPPFGSFDSTKSRRFSENDHQEQADHKPVEVVKWLKLCPVCGGLDFIERKAGGFFCPECQPTPEKEIKRRLRAPGEIIGAVGYGCGKCGNKVYRQLKTGWLCEGCGMVFLVIGGSRGPKTIH